MQIGLKMLSKKHEFKYECPEGKVMRIHKNLGIVFVTLDTLDMDIKSGTETTMFVECDGEIGEVTRSLVSANVIWEDKNHVK